MKLQQLLPGLLLTGSVCVLVAQPAWADVVQVTNVELIPIPGGVEVILETANGAKPQIFTSQSDRTAIFDIVDAQLNFKGNQFRAENPAKGIAAVTVTNLNNKSIQIRVIGTAGVPTAEVFESDEEGLVLSLKPALQTGQAPATAAPETPTSESEVKPQSPPVSESKPAPPTATSESKDEDIEVTVTATRTEQAVTDVPRSVTVINREQIAQQANVSRNVADILGKLVPGFGAPTDRISTFGQSLRGRAAAVLIDGVPQNTNQDVTSSLRTIDPAAIERIEVVRGPTAIYGGGATGGVINIITRRPAEDRLSSTTKLGVNAALGKLQEDSFGTDLQHTLAINQDNVDFTFTFSLANTGSFYDAEDDLIPNYQFALDNTESLNLLGKLGVNLDEQQRLQLTVNQFNDWQDPSAISDPAVESEPGTQKARALRRDLEFIGTDDPKVDNTVINLDYSHDNLLGSQVRGQLYYRDFQSLQFPFDNRDTDAASVTRDSYESEVWGGRLQIDSPFSDTLSLLWGADYSHEKNELPTEIFDPVAYDESEGRIYRKIEDRTFGPPYEVDSLGLFAQLQWDISDRLNLNGGLRHEQIGLNVDDYNTFNGEPIQGGERDFDATVFNIGSVYDLTDEISLFANFAQGFSVQDFGRILRFPPAGFVNVGDDLQVTEPVKVDNYEIGIRGAWANLQASLSAFYNTSELGSTYRVAEDGVLQFVRAPQRNYGLEAALDWQMSEDWQLGGSATLVEGENDEDEDDDYLPLSSVDIQPLKLTAYIQHQTTPGWSNRLQLLFSGNRDRAFDQGVEATGIENYLTVDYISSIKIGSGELEIGIENLFDNQYFPVYSQLLAGFEQDRDNTAGRGRTVRIGYRFNW